MNQRANGPSASTVQEAGTKSAPVLSKRLDGVTESATLKLNALVQSMRAKGEDIANLTAGEPDFPVPEAAKKAAIDAILRNQSKYAPVGGLPELRELVAEKTNRQQPSLAAQVAGKAFGESPGLGPWKAANVIITNGGKQAIFNACLALLNPGDEALIPAPYWLSYPEMVRIASGVPRIIDTDLAARFKLTPTKLAAALSSKTKLLFLNSPSNPTGVMYTKAELQALGEVLQSHPYGKQVWILSDEIYDRIVLSEVPFCSFLEACPGLQSRTVTVNGMSKSCAMTGWRVGWSVAPLEVTQGMLTLQGQSTSGINGPAQWGAIAGMKLKDEDFAQEVSSYRRRLKLALDVLSSKPGLEIIRPDGAFYIFFGVQKFLKSGEDSMGFAERLLREAKVALVPGGPFGAAEFARISFATDDEQLLKGCRRIVEFL